MLFASFLAGVAIDCCGTAVAHNVSHALAGLAPVHHGLATALAFEATLPWLAEAPTPELEAAARACGAASAAALPEAISALMDRCGIVRKLPDAFAGIEAAAIAREMAAPENAPMRNAAARPMHDEDLMRIASAMRALAPVAAA